MTFGGPRRYDRVPFWEFKTGSIGQFGIRLIQQVDKFAKIRQLSGVGVFKGARTKFNPEFGPDQAARLSRMTNLDSSNSRSASDP
jgi:hypothetical protein